MGKGHTESAGPSIQACNLISQWKAAGYTSVFGQHRSKMNVKMGINGQKMA